MNKILIITVTLLCFNTIAIAQIDSAFVEINTSIESGFLVVNDNFNTCIEFKDGDRIKLSSGYQTIKVLSEGYSDDSYILDLDANEEKVLNFSPTFLTNFSDWKKKSTYYKCFWDANVIILSDDDAKTYLNGDLLENSSVRLNLDSNTEYEVTSTINSVSSKITFKASDELNVIENYLRPLEQDILKRSFVPGFAQISKRESTKGYLIIGLISAFAASSIYSQNKIVSSENEFRKLEMDYNNSTDFNEIQDILSASNQELDKIDTFKNVRTLSLTALLATYIYNVIDGRKEPKTGFRYFSFDPYVEFDESMLPKANIKIDF